MESSKSNGRNDEMTMPHYFLQSTNARGSVCALPGMKNSPPEMARRNAGNKTSENSPLIGGERGTNHLWGNSWQRQILIFMINVNLVDFEHYQKSNADKRRMKPLAQHQMSCQIPNKPLAVRILVSRVSGDKSTEK